MESNVRQLRFPLLPRYHSVIFPSRMILSCTLTHMCFWDRLLLCLQKRMYYQLWRRLRRNDRGFEGRGYTCIFSDTRRKGDSLCRLVGGYQGSIVSVRLEHGLLCVEC